MGIIVMYGLLAAGSLGAYFYVRRKKKNVKYKNYLLALAVTGAVCMVAGGLEQLSGEQELSEIKRKEAGGGTQEVQLFLEAGELLQDYEYSVSVEEQKLTEAEAEEIFAQAEQELHTVILGENQSADAVASDLCVPERLLDGLVEVSCFFEPYDLVETDGTILWENRTEDNSLVKVTAQMVCQEQEAVCEFYMQLTPKPPGETEALLLEIRRRIAEENQSRGREYISLPEEINGVRLNWYEGKEKIHIKLLVLGVAGMAAWYVYQKEKREREQKEWNRKLILDYPDIVSQLSLLSGAGMPISAAWAKIASEYREKGKRGRESIRPGYEEMQKTWHEMQDGTGEIKAYENFGKRCNLPQYRKLAAMLMQNVRKGTRGMQQLLDAEANEAFQQRKAYAKQMGEEAGTKLLMPMGIMLILAFAILMLPAMLSLGI